MTRLVTMWMVLVFVLFEIALVAYLMGGIADGPDAATVSRTVDIQTLTAPSCADALADPTDAACAYYHADVTDAGYSYDRDSHRYIKVVIDDDSVRGAV
jgi:hypothetical protein